MKILLFLFLSLNISHAEDEVLRLSELRSKNLDKVLLRYEHLVDVLENQGPKAMCKANLISRTLLEKTLSDNQKLIASLSQGSDFEKEYAVTLDENLATDFFTYFSIEDLCHKGGPFENMTKTLSYSIQNTEYLKLLHDMWLTSYKTQISQ